MLRARKALQRASGTLASMTALLAGASGLVGRELAYQWNGPGLLHLLVRRPLEIRGVAAALQRVHVLDFAALPALPRADEAYCCLGTTIKVAGSQAAFRAVDFDAVLAFARAAQRAGVQRFAVVSALGASPRSPGLVIARPSLLAGDRTALGQPARTGERLALAVTAPLAPLIPKAWRPIAAATVARALRRALAEGRPGVRIVESAELQELGS